ncbi:MAG: hypothetical protein D6698_07175 [Gammaproteobacteria bacterium]|nr:MAG: hypothetical protein D6698_07175 [Gammaproteobacteria bacterium]
MYYKGKYYDKDNVMVSFIWPEGSVGLQFWPKERNLPYQLIRKYIHLQPHIQEMIDDFASQHFSGPVIGVHIRGEGAKDTGEVWLRTQFRSVDPRPYGAYLRAIDARLESDDQARLFVCSDSLQVISDLRQVYGERMITYEATRSQFGEMHIPNHPMNAGLSFSPYKLGEDVLIEACLLSKTDYFIHGNSNVVNFVLSANPDLEHDYVYRQVVSIPPEIGV